MYLRLCPAILDLAGIQTPLLWPLHASIHSGTAVAHRVDGPLIMVARSVGDDLEEDSPNLGLRSLKHPQGRLSGVGGSEGLNSHKQHMLCSGQSDLLS